MWKIPTEQLKSRLRWNERGAKEKCPLKTSKNDVNESCFYCEVRERPPKKHFSAKAINIVQHTLKLGSERKIRKIFGNEL